MFMEEASRLQLEFLSLSKESGREAWFDAYEKFGELLDLALRGTGISQDRWNEYVRAGRRHGDVDS